MNDEKLDSDDLAYVFHRITGYGKLSVEGWKKHAAEQPFDFLYRIRWIDGQEVTLGKLGWERLQAICGRYLVRNPALSRRTTSHHLAEAFKAELEKMIRDKSLEGSAGEIAAMLLRAHGAVEAKFKRLTHFVPCSIFLTEKMKRQRVGPVEFVERETFTAERETQFAELRGRFRANALNTAEGAKQYGEGLEATIKEYFENFGWVGVVEISPAQNEVSYDRAVFLVTAGLNIIRLCLGRPYSYRMRTAEERGRDQRAAKLSCNVDGVLLVSFELGGNDHVQGDACCKLLEEDPTFELGKKALSAFADFEVAPPLCVRFIEALAWYGDAVSEKLAAPRIVKLINAVETLVGTGRQCDEQGKQVSVTKIVCTRATLLYRAATGEGPKKARDFIEKIYQWRSDLVHGSISPFDDSLAAKSHETEEAVRAILIRALHEFDKLGLVDHQFTASELARRFDAWGKCVDENDKT